MLVGDLVYNDAFDLECNYQIYENSSKNVLVDTKKNGFHKPLAFILDMTIQNITVSNDILIITAAK